MDRRILSQENVVPSEIEAIREKLYRLNFKLYQVSSVICDQIKEHLWKFVTGA